MRIMVSEKLGFKRLDPMNIVVFELRDTLSKEGVKSKRDVIIGYYHSLESVLNSIAIKLEIDLEANSIPELIQEFKNINRTISQRLEKLKI